MESCFLTDNNKILLSKKLNSEYQALANMIGIYCQYHHCSSHLVCKSCQSLLEYALVRLDRCPYGDNKPICRKCPIHCYKKAEKQKIKKIMGFSGPRMLFYHPLVVLKHLIREWEKVPSSIPNGQSNRYLMKKTK